ncbi:MAG: glycosyltransferase family 2 protein [Phycisphaerales bacterium]
MTSIESTMDAAGGANAPASAKASASVGSDAASGSASAAAASATSATSAADLPAAVRDARICLVSPGRNEAEYAPRTIESMIAQHKRPDLWVIVDDGSTDASPELLAAAAAEHPWIKIVRREDRGHRAVGPGVIDAFYGGLDTVDLESFDFVGKFDLDLVLPPTYFSGLVQRMTDDPRIGTLSGKAWYRDKQTGEQVSEFIGDEMSIGAAKFYRRACFTEIGGFVREVMWDGIDCHRARMGGWKAASLHDEELSFEHLRPMGSSQHSMWTGRMRHGFGQYFMGTGLSYMSASALYRMIRPPIFVGGLAMWWGFVRAMLGRVDRYKDPDFRRFLRGYQWASLRAGKAATVTRIEAEGAAIWNARHGDGSGSPA